MPGDDTEGIRHRGGDPAKLRLSALEQDILYHHLMETLDETDDAYAAVLGDIMDRLPEEDILTRPPSMETLVEIGYFDQELAEFDAPVIASGGSLDAE
jgi:hypothetical protein